MSSDAFFVVVTHVFLTIRFPGESAVVVVLVRVLDGIIESYELMGNV